MKIMCSNCGHEFKSGFDYDDLGWCAVCPECDSSFDVDGIIRLDDIESWEDVIDAFNTLKLQATKIGLPICLNTETSMDLELYYHEDYPNRILVDKYISNLKKVCRRCGNIVAPSDVVGYPYVCKHCYENKFEFEVRRKEMKNG